MNNTDLKDITENLKDLQESMELRVNIIKSKVEQLNKYYSMGGVDILIRSFGILLKVYNFHVNELEELTHN